MRHTILWFTKSRRAQNDQDYETWITGRVSPTLNAFDNAHETRATVLILDGTRVDDVRVYDDGLTPCLKNRMGTGGNNVPFVAQETTHDVIGTIQARSYKGPNHENARDGQLVIDNTHTTEMQVRRLTPIECERLMGWPDNHTATGVNGPVSDTNRYKMCGNGVASPVAQWIGEAIMRCHPTTSFMDIHIDLIEQERTTDRNKL